MNLPRASLSPKRPHRLHAQSLLPSTAFPLAVVSMQYRALVTILQCQCTRNLEPLRRRNSGAGLISVVPGMLNPSIDIGLVNYVQQGAMFLPRASHTTLVQQH